MESNTVLGQFWQYSLLLHAKSEIKCGQQLDCVNLLNLLVSWVSSICYHLL